MTDNIVKADDNIFIDLQIKDPKESLIKAQLAWRIQKAIQSPKLTKSQSKRIRKLKESEKFDLWSGRLHKVSLDRIIHILNLLDWDIDIVIKRKKVKASSDSVGSIAKKLPQVMPFKPAP